MSDKKIDPREYAFAAYEASQHDLVMSPIDKVMYSIYASGCPAETMNTYFALLQAIAQSAAQVALAKERGVDPERLRDVPPDSEEAESFKAMAQEHLDLPEGQKLLNTKDLLDRVERDPNF